MFPPIFTLGTRWSDFEDFAAHYQERQPLLWPRHLSKFPDLRLHPISFLVHVMPKDMMHHIKPDGLSMYAISQEVRAGRSVPWDVCSLIGNDPTTLRRKIFPFSPTWAWTLVQGFYLTGHHAADNTQYRWRSTYAQQVPRVPPHNKDKLNSNLIDRRSLLLRFAHIPSGSWSGIPPPLGNRDCTCLVSVQPAEL